VSPLSLSQHILLRGLDREAYWYRSVSSLGPFLIGAFFNNILYGVSHLPLRTHVEWSQDVDLIYLDKVCALQVRALQDWEHWKYVMSNLCVGFCVLQKIQTVRLASFFRFTTFSWQAHRDKPWTRYFASYPRSPFLTWQLILVDSLPPSPRDPEHGIQYRAGVRTFGAEFRWVIVNILLLVEIKCNQCRRNKIYECVTEEWVFVIGNTESRAANWEHQINSPVLATSEFDDNLGHHTMLSAMSF